MNLHLCYEAAIIASFLAIARGYSTSRADLEPDEWKGIFSSCIIFYLVNSICVIGTQVGLLKINQTSGFFLTGLVVIMPAMIL